MKSLKRWIRRRREIAAISPRSRELEDEIGKTLGESVRLVPAPMKGGYDEIFTVEGCRRLGILRLNNPIKDQQDPIGPLDPGIPLDDRGRIDREWHAYSMLFPLGLSPEPLVRGPDFMVCSWLPWDRASRRLVVDSGEIWSLLETVLPAIASMHGTGLTHLDLNLGNVLFDPCSARTCLIDFEFGPAPWVREDQQKAFDYLRLIEDCTKPRRGGVNLKSYLMRLGTLLNAIVPAEIRSAGLDFVFAKLQRLAREDGVCDVLREVFPGLPQDNFRRT